MDVDSIIRAAMLTVKLQTLAEYYAHRHALDWKVRSDGEGNFLVETQGRKFRVVVDEIR